MMKKAILTAVLALSVATSNANAMTQEQCEPEASIAPALLAIYDISPTPNNAKYINLLMLLSNSVEFINRGEHCAARNILVSLGFAHNDK